MPALTELRPDGQPVFGFTSGDYTHLADETDTTYIGGSANTVPGTTRFSLTDTPADFLSVDGTLTIALRAALSATGDDTWTIRAVLCDSAGSTTNYGTSSAAQNVTSATPATFNFTVTGVTANKTQMDAAHVEIIVTRSQNMGGDGNHVRVHRLGLTGNYNSDTVLTVADTLNTHTSETPTLLAPPVPNPIADVTGSQSSAAFFIPFSADYYAAYWNSLGTSSVSAVPRFRLVKASADETEFNLSDPASGSSGLGMESSPMYAWRMNDTQVAYFHQRYDGGANIGTVYSGCLALNVANGTMSNGGYGSNTFQPSGVSTGGTDALWGCRMADNKALFVTSQVTATGPIYSVRMRAGTLASTTATSFTYGTTVNLTLPGSGTTRVFGLVAHGFSDTRAVIFAIASNGTDQKIYGQLVSCDSGTGTTVAAIGSWTELNDDHMYDTFDDNFNVIGIDSTRFLLTWGSAASNASTTRTLKSRVIDTTGDTFTLGTPLTIETGTTAVKGAWKTPKGVKYANDKVFVTGWRSGAFSSVTYQSIQSSTVVAGNSMTITKPASTVETDVLYAFFAIDGDNGSVTITPPADWVEFEQAINSGNVGIRTYYKTVGASDPASYVWGFSANVTAVGAIARTNAAAAVDKQGPWAAINTGSGANPTLALEFSSTLMFAVSATDTDVAHTPPSGFTERLDLGAGGTVRLSIATDTNTGTGGTALPFTAASTNWATMQMAAAPANTPEMGYIVDVGASGTTVSLVTELGPLFEKRTRPDNLDPQPSYLTTQGTDNRYTFGGGFFTPGASGNLVGTAGFLDLPSTDTPENHTQEISDALGLTDPAARSGALLRTVGAHILDENNDPILDGNGDYVLDDHDPVGVADTAVASFVYEFTVDDTIGFTDTQARVAAFAPTVTDALGITDTLADQDTVDRLFLELIGALDSRTQTAVQARAPPADPVGVLDDMLPALTASREPYGVKLRGTVS